MKPLRTPSECPVCGAAVPPKALSCPQCGADERTGWNEESTRYDGLDLPDSVFEDSVDTKPRLRRENLASTGVPYFTWIVAVVLLAIVGALVFYRFM